jgi:hypothetical protein
MRRSRHASRGFCALGSIGMLAFLLTIAPHAFAEGDVAAAAAAFSRAQRAELAGDHARAAEFYELADSMAPTPEALRSSLRTRLLAGQRAIAAARAESLRGRYPDDAESKALADKTLAELGSQLGRFEVECRPRACAVIVDDEAAAADAQTNHVIYLEPGSHQIAAAFGSLRADAKPVEAKAGERGKLEFDAPPAPVQPAATGVSGAEGQTGISGGDVARDAKRSGGVSPVWFAVSAVVTTGVGAAAIWSGIDTLNQRDDYDKNRTQEGYEDGLDLERRTNLLFAGTGVAAVCTVVIAAFTDWSGEESSKAGASRKGLRVDVRGAPGGAGIGLGGSF